MAIPFRPSLCGRRGEFLWRAKRMSLIYLMIFREATTIFLQPFCGNPVWIQQRASARREAPVFSKPSTQLVLMHCKKFLQEHNCWKKARARHCWLPLFEKNFATEIVTNRARSSNGLQENIAPWYFSNDEYVTPKTTATRNPNLHLRDGAVIRMRPGMGARRPQEPTLVRCASVFFRPL